MAPYSVDNLKRLLANPTLIPRALRIAAVDANRRWYRRSNGPSDFDIFAEDWDHLLILDAARHDVLADVADIPADRIETRLSPGSYSLEFMEEAFFDREIHDTVYVSANPYTNRIPGGTFHAVRNLLEDHWDDELGTVPPESVIEAATKIHAEFPDKRLIVHFMQPHYPFLGETGRRIESGFGTDVEGDDRTNPWTEQMWGEKRRAATLLRAYRENHEIAIDAARTLAADLTGKTVITADHANLTGERGFPIPMKLYGHPKEFYHPQLLTVPWVELDGERLSITEAPPVEADDIDDNVVEDRLEALGYA